MERARPERSNAQQGHPSGTGSDSLGDVAASKIAAQKKRGHRVITALPARRIDQAAKG